MTLLFLVIAILSVPLAVCLAARASPPEGNVLQSGRMQVLRSRLHELDREVAEGTLAGEQRARVEAEIARELMRETEQPVPVGLARSRKVLVAIALVAPVAAVAIYLALGEPARVDMPLSERTDVAALVSRAEQHLRSNPNDTRGWLVLAPIYRSAGDLDKAARAYRGALEGLNQPEQRSHALTDLAEVELALNASTEAVRSRLEEAARLDPSNEKAAYFLTATAVAGLEPAKEAARWQRLLDRFAGSNAGWVEVTRSKVASLRTAAPKRSGVEAPPAVLAMVASLTARLKSDPNDADGWALLIKSQKVLGRHLEANTALARAGKLFPIDPRFQTMSEATR